MKRSLRLRLILAPVLLLGILGCSDSTPVDPPQEVLNPGGFFAEPRSACLAGTASGDSLGVFNVGDTTLVVTVVHSPPGLTGLPAEYELAPLTGIIDAWDWAPSGPYPVQDSLVLESNDPELSRLTIPLTRQDPAGGAGEITVLAPLLASPGDGDGFEEDDEVPLYWSRYLGCGEVTYRVQVSEDPDFSSSLGVVTPETSVVVVLESGDAGLTLYWRVRTSIGGITGPWSAVRSFRVAS